MTFGTTIIPVNRDLKDEKVVCQEEILISDFFLISMQSERWKKKERIPSVSPFTQKYDVSTPLQFYNTLTLKLAEGKLAKNRN